MDESIGSEIHSLNVFGKIAFGCGEARPVHRGNALDATGLSKLLQLRSVEVDKEGVALSFVNSQVHHAVRIGIGIRVHQDAVDHAEHRRSGADAQRQGQNGDDRESWILPQHPHSVTRIISDVSQPSPSPHLPSNLLHQSHISKFPPRRALRFHCRVAPFQAFPRCHLEMAPHFLFKLRFSLLPPPETHRPPLPLLSFISPLITRHFLLYFSSGCSTPAIASESCDHFERSLVSCFLPAAVSW